MNLYGVRAIIQKNNKKPFGGTIRQGGCGYSDRQLRREDVHRLKRYGHLQDVFRNVRQYDGVHHEHLHQYRKQGGGASFARFLQPRPPHPFPPQAPLRIIPAAKGRRGMSLLRAPQATARFFFAASNLFERRAKIKRADALLIFESYDQS